MTVYVLDTTVLIDVLRDVHAVSAEVFGRLSAGHTLATTCVNTAEVERGVRPRERRRAEALVNRLQFLVTGPEAARRAGRYQAEWAARGRTIQTADALIAGTARAYGAVVLTHNVADFPMTDVRVEVPA
jgi:predicted nucleic acid-binding protein